jgi:hypothetical protein
MTQKGKEPLSPVTKERAMEHALLTFRRAWAGEVYGFDRWGGVEVDPEPLVIHDLNGKILFYEFAALDGGNPVGYVKTSASKTIGSAVPAIILGSRGWDPDTAMSGAVDQAKKLFPKAKLGDKEFICYSYPKIGVKIDLKGEGRGAQSVIFDVASHSVVDRFGGDELEGMTSWSFYHEIVDREASLRERLWDIADKELEVARTKTPRVLEKAFTAREAPGVRPTLVPQPEVVMPVTTIPFYSQQVIQYCRHCSTHDCHAIHAQQTDVYCAVATGQMILDFYRHPYTQSEIAAAMGTTAGGTSNDGQKNGYETLSKKCLAATIDLTADWSEAKAEINANRPLKSGIPGHARACFGWKRQNIALVGQIPKKWLYILDPWPWNVDLCKGGAVVWEDWDAISHTNFIYVRHRTSPCT